MATRQVSFDPLEYQGGAKEAQAVRRVWIADLKKRGARYRVWTLPNQLKKYSGLGVPCGAVRSVYMLTIVEE